MKPVRLRGPGASKPSPYVVKQLAGVKARLGLDLGCGNGRNAELLWGICSGVVSLDPHPDYEYAMGWQAPQPIPLATEEANVILCQYLLMFLTVQEGAELRREITRVAADDCILIVEVEDVKSGRQVNLGPWLRHLSASGWEVTHQTKKRATARRRIET